MDFWTHYSKFTRAEPKTPQVGVIYAKSALGSERQYRNVAIDFTKGALVLSMVLYHWLNYFVSPDGYHYRYLRYVTPSFIFVTGFLISGIYLTRYDWRDPAVSMRLLARGLKLIILFTVLNVLLGLTGIRHVGGEAVTLQRFIESASSVYLTGTSRAAAFWVLLPIGYILVLVASMLTLADQFGLSIRLVTVFLLTGTLIADSLYGMPTTISLMVFGILGMICGFIPISCINTCVKSILLISVIYTIYLLIVSFIGNPYLTQLIGVPLTCLVFYVYGATVDCSSRIWRLIVELGKYSLFGYLAQFAILQLLVNFIHGYQSIYIIAFAALLAGISLTILSVIALDSLRRRSHCVDIIYRAIFS